MAEAKPTEAVVEEKEKATKTGSKNKKESASSAND